MAYLTLFTLCLRLALWIISYLERQKAIAEGEANAVKILLEKADAITRDNWAIRAALSDDPDVILRDEFNEDRAGSSDPTGKVLLRELLSDELQVNDGSAGTNSEDKTEQRSLDT